MVFSAPASPETAFINNVSGTTGLSDANGIVTAKLNLGGNKLNRNIAISATADAASDTNSVRVTGTTLSVSGSTSLSLNKTATLTYTLSDSAANGIAGITLSLASTAANPLCVRASASASCTPSAAKVTGKTNSSGQLTVDLLANQTISPSDSTDTVTASVTGLTDMDPLVSKLTITSAKFGFTDTSPTLGTGAASKEIPIGKTATVSIAWTDRGKAVANTPVNFSITRGTITPATGIAVTDAAGNASVTVSSALAGPATVTAAGTPATPTDAAPVATLEGIAFVSQSAANVTVQAVPGTVAVSTGAATQTNNTATITATVRDGDGLNANLVKNAGITFALTDQTGGTISSGVARTDINGRASVTYTAGAISSAANGVSIRATVTDITGVGTLPTPISSGVPGFPDTALTVANQPLLVRLGTDNKVASIPDTPNNQKVYAAVVTDASGNASIGTKVRFALRPGRYAKGTFVLGIGTGGVWTQNFTTKNPYVIGNGECANEDTNFNGILDTLEDHNGNGVLDPGNAVASVSQEAVTDSSGIALATITYPKDHSYWVEVTLEARTGVVGNDPPTSTTFFLPGPASDYNDSQVAPPGVRSPYGVSNDCGNTQ